MGTRVTSPDSIFDDAQLVTEFDVLIGAIPYDEQQLSLPREQSGRTGTRAIFIVECDGGWKRVITSRVVKVVHAQVRSRDLLPVIP
jgi:hypothetical protein